LTTSITAQPTLYQYRCPRFGVMIAVGSARFLLSAPFPLPTAPHVLLFAARCWTVVRMRRVFYLTSSGLLFLMALFSKKGRSFRTAFIFPRCPGAIHFLNFLFGPIRLDLSRFDAVPFPPAVGVFVSQCRVPPPPVCCPRLLSSPKISSKSFFFFEVLVPGPLPHGPFPVGSPSVLHLQTGPRSLFPYEQRRVGRNFFFFPGRNTGLAGLLRFHR